MNKAQFPCLAVVTDHNTTKGSTTKGSSTTGSSTQAHHVSGAKLIELNLGGNVGKTLVVVMEMAWIMCKVVTNDSSNKHR